MAFFGFMVKICAFMAILLLLVLACCLLNNFILALMTFAN